MKSYNVTIQMKAFQQYLTVVMFILLHNLALNLTL